jgi:hypothetical protein
MAVTGASPIFGPPSISEARFVSRLRVANSPAADEGADIYRRMIKNGVDPLIALAQFQAESGLGTRGHAVDTRNWGNILFYGWTTALGATEFEPGNGYHYSLFPSWTQGARAYIRLMKRYRAGGFDSVEKMAARWLGDKVGTARTNQYVGNIVQAAARFAPPPGPAPAPVQPAPAHSPVIYIVQPGDSLSVIAERELGAAVRWREIYAIPANRVTIGDNPGLITPGQRLIMPRR